MIFRLHTTSLLSLYLTEEGQALGKVLVKASKDFEGVSAPRIHKSSDSAKEKAIKNIISKMLQFEPANRITAAEVVDRLSKLKGDKAEGQQPKSRMAKWFTSSKT